MLKEEIMSPKLVAPSYSRILTLAQPFHRQLPFASLPEYERPIGVDGRVKSFERYCYITVSKGNKVITRGDSSALVSNDISKRHIKERKKTE